MKFFYINALCWVYYAGVGPYRSSHWNTLQENLFDFNTNERLLFVRRWFRWRAFSSGSWQSTAQAELCWQVTQVRPIDCFLLRHSPPAGRGLPAAAERGPDNNFAGALYHAIRPFRGSCYVQKLAQHCATWRQVAARSRGFRVLRNLTEMTQWTLSRIWFLIYLKDSFRSQLGIANVTS